MRYHFIKSNPSNSRQQVQKYNLKYSLSLVYGMVLSLLNALLDANSELRNLVRFLHFWCPQVSSWVAFSQNFSGGSAPRPPESSTEQLTLQNTVAAVAVLLRGEFCKTEGILKSRGTHGQRACCAKI